MSLNQITKQVNELSSAWEEFKGTNDQSIKELKSRKSSDSLLSEKLDRLNQHMDECKEQLDNMETLNDRPDFSCKSNNYANKAEQKAFTNYIKSGMVDNIHVKALSESNGASGGYLLTNNIRRYIDTQISQMSPMRQLASVENISGSTIDYIVDNGEFNVVWDSGSSVTEETPTEYRIQIAARELSALAKATQTLLDDSFLDVNEWLSEKLAYAFNKAENTAFISGNGTTEPAGILSYPNGDPSNYSAIRKSTISRDMLTDSSMNDTFVAELADFFDSLPEEYTANASVLVNKSTALTLRRIKDQFDQYIWTPGLTLESRDTLFSVPVYLSSDVPEIGTSGTAKAIILADFKNGYKIVDRQGLTILRDPYSDKPNVSFYATKRVGGGVVNHKALSVLEFTA